MEFHYLVSLKNHDLYIGSCEHLRARVYRHNRGAVKSTKAYHPWKLLGSEEYNTRSEAFKRERFLKNHQQKEILKEKFKEIMRAR